MTKPLFQLGSFQFDLPNGVPQTLDRTAEFRWESQERLLRDPAVQFLGPGSQEITLDGQLFPGFSGRQSTMETLRELATQGQPQMLTDGLGRVYGKWAIRQIREGLGTFAPGGGARQIGFSISLVRYVEDNPGQSASPLALAFSSAPDFGISSALSSGFTGIGSAFDVAAWAKTNPLAVTAQNAGFSLGQLGGIARSVGNGNYVSAALGAFGIAGLNLNQSNAWTQLGIDTVGILSNMAQGRGAPTMAVLLETLRPVSYQTMQQLAGSVGGADGIQNLARDAATIVTMLDVDPFVTADVRQVLQGVSVLSSSYAVTP